MSTEDNTVVNPDQDPSQPAPEPNAESVADALPEGDLVATEAPTQSADDTVTESELGDTAPTPTAKKPKKVKKPAKFKKPKVIRDSFTMPEFEYAQIEEIKQGCLRAGYSIKKSEILRIGVAMIARMQADELQQQLARLLPIKTGRPKKDKR
ncbi:MAG: hypothetical protein ACFCUG_04705 [Thiotrichales bacterium]